MIEPLPRRHFPMVAEIDAAITAFYGLEPGDLSSDSRSVHIAHPRQLGMWIARALTGFSYPTIASKFGRRDHTTAVHAVRKIDALLRRDIVLAGEAAVIIATVAAAAAERVGEAVAA